MLAEPDIDHRTRTGARRRKRMRRRLIESALVVIAERGIEGAGVDEVIRTAGVSRGSYYNYFSTTRELVQAAGDELKGELFAEIVKAVEHLPDPASQVAGGFAVLAATVTAYPQLAHFVQSLDFADSGPVSEIAERFPALLRAGVEAGQFVEQPSEAMIDLITGCVVKCVARSTRGDLNPTYTRHLIASVLRGLGLSPDQAWAISAIEAKPLDLTDNGLLGRLHRISGNRPVGSTEKTRA